MRILTLSIIAALAIPAMPAVAQRSERVLTIFGNDKCPENTICVTAPERDRYRIPKEFRGPSELPENQSWAARAGATLDTGKTNPTGNCSAAGAGNWTGCYMQQMRQAREDAKKQKKAEEAVADALP